MVSKVKSPHPGRDRISPPKIIRCELDDPNGCIHGFSALGCGRVTRGATDCAKHLYGLNPRSVSGSTTAAFATPKGSWAIAEGRVPEIRSFLPPAHQSFGFTP